jgi:hypothetical protein
LEAGEHRLLRSEYRGTLITSRRFASPEATFLRPVDDRFSETERFAAEDLKEARQPLDALS